MFGARGIKRRDFVALAGCVAVMPFSARAQQKAMPVIGFLGPTSASASEARAAAFSQRLRELAWIDGRTVAIAYRWADGRSERFADLTRDLLQTNADVIVTWGTATVLAAMKVTSQVPIVFALVSDPVGTGIVASLARPGGNVTGLSTQHIDAAGKRLELLREIVPDLKRLGVMINAGNEASVIEMRELQVNASALGIRVVAAGVKRSEEIAKAFEAVASHADALFIVPDQLFATNQVRLNELALSARLPTMHGFREPVQTGALMSFGPDYLDMFRRTADMVDRIVRGGKPADIPVEQPTKFELVINLKTAKTVGITVPPLMLARADAVIE